MSNELDELRGVLEDYTWCEECGVAREALPLLVAVEVALAKRVEELVDALQGSLEENEAWIRNGDHCMSDDPEDHEGVVRIRELLAKHRPQAKGRIVAVQHRRGVGH